ncbi:MAG: acyltransferase [Methylotenera sp.]
MLPGGFIGVDVFLVISGYLITQILMSQKLKSNQNILHTLKFFYFSRIKRIAPAYFVMLFATTVVAAILYIPPDYNTFYKSLKSALYFNSNHYFAGFGDYFAPSALEQPLLHTWSLAVEIQFYLLLPLSGIAFNRKSAQSRLFFINSFINCIS